MKTLTNPAARLQRCIDDIIQSDINGWQQSQERVLRYLQVLGVPPVISIEISYEVMRCAADRLAQASDSAIHPTQAAMRVLRDVLSEGRPPACGIPILGIHQADTPAAARPGHASDRISGGCRHDGWKTLSNLRSRIDLPSMPGLKRGSMRPAMTWPSLFNRLAAIFLRPKRG